MAEVAEVVGTTEPAEEGYVAKRGGGGYLPPIHRLVLPKTTTQSALVRWLWSLGYEVKEISRGLGVRYQQARNMIVTVPKRAAREDLPPLEIRLREMEDVVDALLGSELERTHEQSRKEDRRKARKEGAGDRRAAFERKDGKPKGKPVAPEDEFGNEDLDDENYGRL